MDSKINSPLVRCYLEAKALVIRRGYAHEIDWQDSLSFDDLCEPIFLKQAAWVVLNSGMREKVIRKLFPRIAKAFRGWSSATEILDNRRSCRRDALKVFSHQKKIDAIFGIAERVNSIGFPEFKTRIGADFKALSELPYIGPVTLFHLAKNIGLDVVKPDRHLVRMAEAAGVDSPHDLCQFIAQHVGDRLSVIDLVLWRFATITPDYELMFDCASASSLPHCRDE
jgi:hypothetical protein